MRNLNFFAIILIAATSLFSCQDDDIIKENSTTSESIERVKPKHDLGTVKKPFRKMQLLYDCEDHVYNIDNFGYIPSTPESTFYFYFVPDEQGIFLRCEWNLLDATITHPETSDDWRTIKYSDNLFQFYYIGDTSYGAEYLSDWSIEMTILKRL